MARNVLKTAVLGPGPYGDIEEKIQLITEALRTYFQLVFQYDGFSRIVDPYEVGYTKRGDVILRCYQTSGGSVGARDRGWKTFRLDRMSMVDLGDENFVPIDEYYDLPPDWTVDVIQKI